MNKAAKRALLFATTVVSLAAPAIAQAQTQDDEIVVTARRREENLQDVPLAVSLLNGDELERNNVTSIMDLNGSVPNLVVSNGLGSGRATPVFTIRGLSQQDLTMLSDPSVSLYVNEIAVPRPIGANVGFFDTESVQVLRGPQGTLFGRNTVGGAILVTPNAPTREFEGSISQSFANYGTYETQAVLNVPLGDGASFRVAGLQNTSDGYITDLVTGDEINFVDEQGLRVSFDLHPTPNFNSLTTATWTTIRNGGTGGVTRSPAAAGVAPFPHGRLETRSGLVTARSNVDVFSLENITTIDLNENFTLKNVAGYRELQNNTLEDVDGSDALFFVIQRITEQNQFSEELQLQGEFDWGNLIVGGFWFNETGDDQGWSVGPGLGAAFTPSIGNPAIEDFLNIRDLNRYNLTWVGGENTSWAVFAQTDINITEALTATIGARLNHDERQPYIRNRRNVGILQCGFGLPITPTDLCQFDGDASFEEPTYNLSLQYEASDDLMFYAATRHGYRSGGYGARGNTPALLADTFEPELVTDYEIGMKAEWSINGALLRTNVALFHADYTDIQRLLSPDPIGAPSVTVTWNAGEATIDGAELEFVFRPTEWLEFAGFYAYTKTDFVEFIGPPPANVNLAGNPFSRAPENIASASVTVDLPMPVSMGDANLGVRYFHQDRYNASDSFNPLIHWFEAQDLVNFTAEWNGVFGSNVDLLGFVNNAFDNEYVNPYFPNSPASVNSVVAGEPRTYGVRVRYSFGE